MPPCARWTGQQIINAFPDETAPRYLHRDWDAIYGSEFISRVRARGLEQVVSAARSPWQNPYVEQMIGSIRRECMDHLIVTSAAHLRRVLREYVASIIATTDAPPEVLRIHSLLFAAGSR